MDIIGEIHINRIHTTYIYNIYISVAIFAQTMYSISSDDETHHSDVVLVCPPCPVFIACWVEDRYQALLARWRSLVWKWCHWEWLARLRTAYELRPQMARWKGREERRIQSEHWWLRWQ